ncbi:hypothetical protein [Microcoleus sp. bin38.metabat.b11b12b14.051]|uniref:hypothetical protein n=1 Tax=Microcoleus sp. bin38.metabat.b11b12b14.051 TaxID=2742709 RepID=UPI0025E3E026|nr:hypothetical protein [Microcoleus sp. bin38.metabat.b11b12b14.051]
MSDLILQLTNPSNWEELDYQTLSGGLPLPDYTLPIQLEKHIIACYCNSPSAEAHWKFAGWVSQKIFLGIGGVSSLGESVTYRKIWLKKTQLIIFQPLTSNYSLTFSFAKWLKDMEIGVWQYTGPVSDSVIQAIGSGNQQTVQGLIAIQSRLQQIEIKIDSLL